MRRAYTDASPVTTCLRRLSCAGWPARVLLAGLLLALLGACAAPAPSAPTGATAIVSAAATATLTPPPVPSATPIVLPDSVARAQAAGRLTPVEAAQLAALLAARAADWRIDPADTALRVERTPAGAICLLLTDADGAAIRLIYLTSLEPLAAAQTDLAAARAAAAAAGADPAAIAGLGLDVLTGLPGAFGAAGELLGGFDPATGLWQFTPPPTPEPTPAPTETPAPPEQPAGMIQFDGYTITYEKTAAGQDRWVQKNEKGAVRTVWNEATGKWEIPASVKSIEIGPEGVDHGLVVALSVEEIRKLMEQQPGRLPLPIRLNDVKHVEIKEGSSTVPFLKLNGKEGLGGVEILHIIGGLASKSSEGRGKDGGTIYCFVWINKNTGHGVMFSFPGSLGQNIDTGEVQLGTPILIYEPGNVALMNSADPDYNNNEFAWAGRWSDQNGKELFAQFEDLLIDPHGRPVLFR